MQSNTSQTDQIYCEAALIEIPYFAPSYSEFYQRLDEQENLIYQASQMEAAVRGIRK